ncbi:MAG: hypothetical protein IT204_13720 [Fimbriimonadaceae bacterium]|nr:hypothetical protein [Fimbriimonadaceae bacterium]
MRTRTGWLALAMGLLLTALPGQAALPKTLEELQEQHKEAGKTPEGLSKLWFDACFVYINEETRDEGRKMIQWLTIPLKDEPGWDRSQGQTYFVRALKEQQYIIRSYAKGAKPDNNYQMDPENYELNIEKVNLNPPGVEGRGIQVYLRSGGADTPRPVYLMKSKQSGLWYMNLHTNVYTGIRPPVDPNKETFG